eukprot:9439341-Pyramimonas_sp.AAC.1
MRNFFKAARTPPAMQLKLGRANHTMQFPQPIPTPTIHTRTQSSLAARKSSATIQPPGGRLPSHELRRSSPTSGGNALDSDEQRAIEFT